MMITQIALLRAVNTSGNKAPGSAPRLLRAPPRIRTRPFRASGSSGLRFRCPLLSATVALTRLSTTLSSSRVSQWQFRKPTPPLATHRLPRVGFPAFRRYYEGATTSFVHFGARPFLEPAKFSSLGYFCR